MSLSLSNQELLNYLINFFYCSNYSQTTSLHQFSAFNADVILQQKQLVYALENDNITMKELLKARKQLTQEKEIFQVMIDYQTISLEQIQLLKLTAQSNEDSYIYLLENNEQKYLIKFGTLGELEKHVFYTEAFQAQSFENIWQLLYNIEPNDALNHDLMNDEKVKELMLIYVENEKLKNVIQNKDGIYSHTKMKI